MFTSRRLVLASAALVLGFSACGSANSTTSGSTAGSATVSTAANGGPKVITFGSGTAAGSSLPATGDSAEKMMAIRNLTYVFDGDLPVLSDTGVSWQFPGDFTPDAARIAAMADVLGVVGEVRQLPADQGGGWMVGPEDYSAATLTVSADGLGSWWFNPTPIAVSTTSACGIDPAVDVLEGETLDTVSPLDSDVVADPSVVPPCPDPAPPVGVPGEDASLSRAKALFAELGYDPAAYDFEFYGDEWNANVTAYLVLDGQRTPVSMSVGFGAEGALVWSSGNLATPVRADSYPLIGAQAGVERLNDQAQQWMGIGMGMGYAGAALRTEASAVIEPMPVQCDPAACTPVDTTPITIHLTTVKPDLTMVWDADNTVWLLPAYTFGDADGGQYTVLAIADEYLDIPASEPVPATSG